MFIPFSNSNIARFVLFKICISITELAINKYKESKDDNINKCEAQSNMSSSLSGHPPAVSNTGTPWLLAR